jgi:hypothetical protein
MLSQRNPISAPRFGERSEPERGAEIERRANFSACYWPVDLLWLLPMQIRASSFKGDRPACPLNPNHKVHCHGTYDRYDNCDDEHEKEKEDIDRYLCLPCGHTISVLPDCFLPYRAISVPLVQKHFDAQADPGQSPEPPATEKERGCLKRAWNRFGQRLAALATVLGQVLQIRARSSPKLCWTALRQRGNLEAILLQLAQPFNTSLLHDYLCLRPWSSPAG